MNILMVSYDLHKLGQRYAVIHAYINKNFPYIRPLESLYLIKTNLSASSIIQDFKLLIDGNDEIFVAEINKSNCIAILKPINIPQFNQFLIN